MDAPPSYGTLLDARARNHLYMRWASRRGGVGGGGCGGGNQITQQIESHHLSIRRPSPSSVRPSVRLSVRSAKFALHLALFANGHGTHSGGDGGALFCKGASIKYIRKIFEIFDPPTLYTF